MVGIFGSGETEGPGIGTLQPSGIMDSLVKYGAVKEVGDIFGDIAGTGLKIFAGEDAGTTASSIVEGAGTGFKIGAIAASVVGTAGFTLGSLVIPGGVIIAGFTILGSLLGNRNGKIKAAEKRFDSLNGYVGGQLDAAEAAEQESLQRGIAISMADTEGLYYQAEVANALFQTMLDKAKGAGYAGQRSKDTDENRDAYIDHGLDDAMAAMEAAIGQSEAFLVGLGEDYQREATALLINGAETAPGNALYDGKSAERLGELHEQYAALTEELKQITDAKGGLTDRERAAEIGVALKALKTETSAIAEDRYHGSEFSLKMRDAELLLTANLQRDARDADHSWDEEYNRAQVLGGADPEDYISIKPEPETPSYLSWVDTEGIVHNPKPGMQGDWDEEGNLRVPEGKWAYVDEGGNLVVLPKYPIQPKEEPVLSADPAEPEARERIMPGFPVQPKEERRAQREEGPRERTEQKIDINIGPVTIQEVANMDKLIRKIKDELSRKALLAVPR